MTLRPAIVATHYAVSSGHRLASEAGIAMLEMGGNAVDAGVAAGLALGVVHSDLVNVAGVAPIMVRMADSGRVVSIDGLGTWPEKASAEFFAREFNGQIPEGILRTVVPAAPAAWLTALKDFGTLRFADVAAPAIRIAAEGFAVYPLFAEIIASNEDRYRSDIDTARIYLPCGKPPAVGELFIQSDLAASLQYMVDEESANGGDRISGLNAARHAFYRGDIAQTICDYHQQHGGFLTMTDMANYRVRYESPVVAQFGGCDVYCCGAWSQGISLAQTFAMLDADRLKSLEHNSADYIHHLVEVVKLAFADRERYVADPAFEDVPVDAMLDQAYLQKRLGLINPARAFADLPPAGDPRKSDALVVDHDALSKRGNITETLDLLYADAGGDAHATVPHDDLVNTRVSDLDTSHVGVVDSAGNMFVATPSDTSSDTVVIPGTGLCPSSRGSQSRGIIGHVNAVAPGKRPRLTPNPALLLKDGKPFMTLGTPGGDVQVQAMVQVVANIICQRMDVQEAIEAPRFATYSFPSSFAPNNAFPGLLMLEQRIDEDAASALMARGHKVERWGDFSWKAGAVNAIVVNEDHDDISAPKRLRAGADPRRANVALGD